MIFLLLAAFTLAYQADKPCDDACFRAKMEHEFGTARENTRDENDWRYRQRRR